ncbi:MAG TPA: MFS transporter [Thermoplasmata archaeon]
MTELARRVRRFYAYTGASSFALWIPFWTLWIRGNVGSDFEFTLVDVAFWLGMLAFQLPVGVMADRVGRKRTIVLSEAIRSAGILGYGLGMSFAGYVIANVVWSLGAAFSIGTSAYLYDALLEAGHESEFPRYIGRNTTIQLVSNAAGAFAGGLFVQAVGEIRLTLFVGAALNLAAVAVALTFAEPNVARTTEPTYAAQLRQGLRIVRRREGVALLIGLEVFLGITLYAMALFRPLYLQFLGLSPAEIALAISGFLLIAAVCSAFAGGIARRLGEFGTIALMVALASAAFVAMFGAGRWAAAVLFQIPIYVVWSLQPALTTAFLNRRLEPGQRATVLSMGSFAYTLGIVILEPLVGLLTTATELVNLGLFLGAVTVVPCSYILVRWRTTVTPWPAVTPLPSRLLVGARVSRFHRLFERLSRLRP